MQYSHAEECVLHDLIEEAAGDIVVRLDREGFILQASENIAELGMDLPALLVMPHIADLAEASHAPLVADHARQILAGNQLPDWIEFPVPVRRQPPDGDAQLVWFAFSMRLVEGDKAAGLGLLRSVDHLHLLEGEISNSAKTDPLTGLANRIAFFEHLQQAITSQDNHTMALIALDHLRAINMQYGQDAADEILWGFSRFLYSMSVPGQELAQIHTNHFAVLMPEMRMRQARMWTQEVLDVFAGLTFGSSKIAPEVTASAGLARARGNIDATMRQAEIGLVMAKAGGGMQIGIGANYRSTPRELANNFAVQSSKGHSIN